MSNFVLHVMKYIFRSLHISTFGLLFGNMLTDYFFNQKMISPMDEKSYKLLMMFSGIILMGSGLINMILLIVENKYLKNPAYKIWKNLLIIKFFIALTLTPLIEKLPFIEKENISKIRVYVVLGSFLLSPFLRFFRETNLISNKNITKKEAIIKNE